MNSIVGYVFKDKHLLNTALTHSSYTADFGGSNYERLEYLGDSILGEVVAEYLYKNFDLSAGEMSKYRAKLVNEKVLASLIVNLGIDKLVKVGKSIKQVSKSIYADVYESLLAAIYLDGGDYKQFVYSTLLVSKKHILELIDENKDYKTLLQELLAKKHLSHEYILLSKNGEGTNATFEVQLIIDGKCMHKCKEKSIKLAEQKCAEYAYTELMKNA